MCVEHSRAISESMKKDLNKIYGGLNVLVSRGCQHALTAPPPVSFGLIAWKTVFHLPLPEFHGLEIARCLPSDILVDVFGSLRLKFPRFFHASVELKSLI